MKKQKFILKCFQICYDENSEYASAFLMKECNASQKRTNRDHPLTNFLKVLCNALKK